MAVIQKTLFAENLDRYNTFVQDTDPNSKYFKITELPDTFTGGKNAFLIQGSQYLVPDTLIKIELKDASGNTIYHEPGEGIISSSLNGEEFITEYYEGVSKVVAVYIYPETAYGPCTLTILGELSQYENNGLISPVPLNWQGQYNVKWQKQINVNPSLANTTKIRFYKRPTAAITELVSPIYRIDSNTGIKTNSGINQSFADIKLSQMETFAGDVKRIKVFRTSLGDISDYDMIQDILVESKEELTSYSLSGSVVGNAGLFTSEVLEKLWTKPTGMSVILDSTRVDNGIKLISTNSNLKFAYTSSLNLSAKSVYEFGIDAFYSSSLADNTLDIYLSGSINGEVLIGTLNGISPTKNLKDQTIQFSLDKSEPSASLYLKTSVGDYETKPYEWHIGNLSLKLSQDTAFSPDSVSFITSMPMIVGNQDYNFKFEFYDINNNYVPVAVTQSANFTGGSTSISKLLTFETDRTAFRFSSGSVGNPPSQFVRFKTQRTNFTGSVTYSSASFDIDGNYIVPASYGGEYPGALTNASDSGALLSIAKFSGSVSSVIVGSITYTASCEGIEEYETIYRFEDGDNAPGVFVTSNTNQFIYKATDLSLNPSGQTITIEAKRKNLASATTPLTVNSGSGKPPLTFVSTNATNGVDTYTIAGTAYPYGTGETTYYISGSDQFGNEFSDAIKISPVKILDGLSATLTNDNASLPALSNGFVASGSFILSSGSVTVKVGNESITFDDDNDSSRANNTFAITNLSGTGCTPNGGNNSNPSTNSYSITNLTQDSGSLDITISYKDGAGDTTSIVKTATYTKNKKAAPVLSITSTNKVQSVSAKSTGTQIDSFSNATVTVSETYNGSTSNLTITSLTATSSDISSISTTASTGLVTLNGKTLADGTNSTTIAITAVVTDSEGVSRTITDTISLSKVKKAPPTITFAITPSSQTVAANSAGTLTGTIVDPILTAFEGSSALTYNQGTLSTSQYKITNVTGVTVGSTTPSTSTIDVTGISSTDNTGVVTIAYVDSEGTSGTSTIKFTISKAIAGVQGTDGATGADGKRTATGMVHYQLSAASAPSTPSATSFTFSNGTFSSLTANWGTGAPTFAAGNSNKYWYSTYTVVETTAGGGTGTPSFGTPTQAIGFSGLVSFSAANNVSDGSNSLSFGVSGTTLINGSNISTGKITSTNYSAGSPYTSAGSIIDLDNGRIATKTFYVDSNGDAVFKGTLSAAGGTFAGQITVGGTNYNLSDTLNANTTATQVGLGNVSNLTPQNQAQTGLIAGTTITGGGITLSGGGNIKGGQTDYNTGTGFFLGYHGSAYKFSIGNASTKGITWDGSTLSIGGDVNIGSTLASTVVSNASTALSNAATAQSTADGKLSPGTAASDVNNNSTNISGNKIRTGVIQSNNHSGTADGSDYSSAGMSIDLTAGGISAKNFRITSGGDAYFKGNISGASGTFGGSISIGSGNSIFKADTDGIYLGNATFGSAPFRVTPGGSLSATNANLTGNITATGGTLGGWVIDGQILRDSASRLQLNPGSPSMDIYDSSGAKRLTVKYGSLTSPWSGDTAYIDPPGHSFSTITLGAGYSTNTIRSSGYNTFYVNAAGTYFIASYASATVYSAISTNGMFNGYVDMSQYSVLTDNSGNFLQSFGGSYGNTSSPYASVNLTGYSSGVYVTFPASGTYRVYGEFAYDAYIYAGNAYVQGSADDPALNVSIQLDIAEVSSDGFQVISSADSYCRIQRGASYAIDAKGSMNIAAPSGYYIYLNGLVHPMVGNTNDLGTTGNRWKTVWTNNALNSTSDERLKNSIEDTDLGLEFVNKLRPVKYKNNSASSPRYHYGLIAQELIGTLNDFNKTTSDVGFIASASFDYTEEDVEKWKTRDDWNVYESEISASVRGELGLAYTELISPMIKAIQELTAKVEMLEAKLSGSV